MSRSRDDVVAAIFKAVPPSHCIPLHERPVDPVPIVKDIPPIDLEKAKGEERPVVQQLLKACEEYGFFQVINHGVREDLMEEAMEVYKEFFSLSVEEKAHYAKEAANNTARGAATLYSSNAKNYDSEEHRYWRDVIGSYSDEVRKLSKVILGLVSEGLGLEAGYFDKELGQRMLVNHYPACPNPSLTLRVGGHCDPNLITIIQQEVYGLQILKDEKWMGNGKHKQQTLTNYNTTARPVVISNRKLASVAHRVVTNTIQARTSIGTFICPEDVVEPANHLLVRTIPRYSNPSNGALSSFHITSARNQFTAQSPAENSDEYALFDKVTYQKHLNDATLAKCVMLSSMTMELQRQHENMGLNEML
ncbi:hypothetical protein RND71_038246 [Anisodus tanguticus]|uniref:Fe2OG dioxygenase domain-containing protein n=1 Tax=Anisodus tanguticus TaxID=243964 RepID=A0AAE1UZA8_9SOLA|nr:hypothetical protein RND71_038246 [Anisodus tanguticus]